MLIPQQSLSFKTSFLASFITHPVNHLHLPHRLKIKQLYQIAISRERNHRKMQKSAGIHLICAVILVIHMIALSFPAVSAASSGIAWIPATAATAGGGCRGSTAECLAEGGDLDIDDLEEFSMDSESTRRILATNRRYISYGALSKNNVPCSRRGASYYNCRSGGQANPYSRGCSTITRCRR